MRQFIKILIHEKITPSSWQLTFVSLPVANFSVPKLPTESKFKSKLQILQNCEMKQRTSS
jgi:hypothetical protein